MTSHLLFLDFETYYDDEYSLRKMTPAEYILDRRFETILCSVKLDSHINTIVDKPDIPAYLAKLDPNVTTTVTYNALFDNCILAWRYGFVPNLMIDALGMARALLGHKLPRLSLDKVAEHLGLGAKGHTIQNVKGMNREAIRSRPELWREYCNYSLQDNFLCEGIFKKLIGAFPPSERNIMDLVIRCVVNPRFAVDTEMLRQHLDELRIEKEQLLKEAGVIDRADVMSTAKFAALLKDLGIDPEYKTSPTGKLIPAFAKTDEFMTSLLEHEDSKVQALAAARLGHKSTLEETRGERLLKIADLSINHGPQGPTMPVPLRYSGAHTHRLSGDWGMNMQNLPSGRGLQRSKLRSALIAPPGYRVIVADLGQIEARLSAWLCGATVLLGQFANKLDPYAKLGGQIFGIEVDPAVHKLERFIGKNGVLGLGYGAAGKKFYAMVIAMARGMGMDMTELKKVWTQELANKAVSVYRRVNFPICNTWTKLDFILQTAWMGNSAPVRFGPVLIGHGFVEGPGGLKMLYDNPRVDTNGEMVYTYAGRVRKIYGAKFLENIIQFLARIIVMNAALRISKFGHKFVLQAHDELVFIVKEGSCQDVAKLLIEAEMLRVPSWATGLPLSVNVGEGSSYGDAK